MKIACEDFRQRLNEVVDQRVDPREDRALRQHASRCPSCGCELEAWVQIQSIYLGWPQNQTNVGASPRNISWGILVATAAAILFGAVGSYFALRDQPETLVSIDSNEPLPQSTQGSELANFSVSGNTSSTNPTSLTSDGSLISFGNRSTSVEDLWLLVQQRDWIDQSMPTVRKVRESVAPLGRSLRKAVSILTTGGGETS
jgi:Putative zinc-finger